MSTMTSTEDAATAEVCEFYVFSLPLVHNFV